MFFGNKNHLTGLDIGSRTIKAGEVAETKKGLSLKKFGMVDIAPGAIVEGSIKDPESVAGSIRQLFKTYNLKIHNVAISIGVMALLSQEAICVSGQVMIGGILSTNRIVSMQVCVIDSTVIR